MALRSGELDLLLTFVPPPEGAGDLHAVRLGEVALTQCCLSVRHPRIGESISLDEYLAERHVTSLQRQRTRALGPIDQALVSMGWEPRSPSTIHSMARLAQIVASTDRLATVTLNQGMALMRSAEGLRCLALPSELPRLVSPRFMIWHHRTHQSPPHRWLRTRVRSFMHDVGEPLEPMDEAGLSEPSVRVPLP